MTTQDYIIPINDCFVGQNTQYVKQKIIFIVHFTQNNLRELLA